MSSELSYSSIKISHQIRENEEKKAKEKKRHILYLVQNFLKTEGYSHTARAFTHEAQLTNQYEVCDNVDLSIILQDFESYYNMRFSKFPKICKKVLVVDEKELASLSFASRRDKKSVSSDIGLTHKTDQTQRPASPQKNLRPSSNSKVENSFPSKEYNRINSLHNIDLTVVPVALSQTNTTNKKCVGKDQSSDSFSERILKPLGGYIGFTGEWRELAEIISKEICMTNLNVRWEDIKGLEEAKRLLKEAVVYPTKYPELFSGVLAPWKGLLLYGPPGTGKTLLAKAVATECGTTFFNISASTIVSKWRGDSEKLVRVMFELARYHAPSTIFLDEMDALASHRDGAEHEATRRLKTELLIQLDGLAHTEDRVFLLAASNLPWELDAAMLRRLEKRILVDLPNTAARQAMLHHHLPPLVVTQPALRSDIDYACLARDTAGYSGSDIKLVCKEAAMAALRAVFSVLEAHQDDKELPTLELKTITTHDLQQALAKTKPSAVHLVSKYQKWQKEFGSM